jgi:hypothetical protein
MQEKFVYHLVPKNFQGTTIHPLNELKVVHPAIYSRAVSKYDNRKQVLDWLIPNPLDCLWNDAIHTTSVDIQKL